MMLLACLASALLASIITTCAAYLLHRDEAARIAYSRADLARQWKLLGEVWRTLDPATRPKVFARLTWGQRCVLLSQLALADIRAHARSIVDGTQAK